MKQARPRVKKTRKTGSRERQHSNPPRVAVGWGRGGSAYRPGLFTKQYFANHGEACCADVFHALKEDLRRINRGRVGIGDAPIRGCTYNSYAKYWHWFKLAGLIEPTGETEPAIYNFLKKRLFYTLTASGASEEAAWEDPVRTLYPTL